MEHDFANDDDIEFDFVIVIVDPRDFKRAVDVIVKKMKKLACVISLSRTSYANRSFSHYFNEILSKKEKPVLLEGVIGTDICVRKRSSDQRDAYEPVLFNGIAMQRLTSEELKRGGPFIRMLEGLTQHGTTLSYRSGISKSLWGSSILHTSVQCASGLTPRIPLRRAVFRSYTFRSLLSTMSAEIESAVYATFRNPKGKQWSVDTAGNSVLSVFAFQAWLSLPSCWISAWTRLCCCCNPMGHDLPFGARTSLQRDLQRCHDVGSSCSTQFDVVELKAVLKLARSRGVKTPVSDRILEVLLKGGHPGVDTLSEAERIWTRILGNKSGVCGLAVRTGSWGLSNLFLHITKGIFVCALVWIFMFVQSKLDFF